MQPFSLNHAVPFVFLLLLALFSFWLNEMVKNAPPLAPKEHIPDSYAYNVKMLQLDEAGNVRYELKSPEMQHFPDDDSAYLSRPLLTAFRENAPPIVVSAQDAVVAKEGEVVYLYNGTTMTREAFAKRGALKALAPYWVVLPKEDYAFTHSVFQLFEEDDSWVKALGAEFLMKQSLFKLKSRVSAQVQPQLLKKR